VIARALTCPGSAPGKPPAFQVVEILGPAVAVSHAPAGAFAHDVAERVLGQLDEAVRAHPGGHRDEEGVDQLTEPWTHLGLGEIGPQHAHAAVDVEADAARRDDAAVGAKCGHSADGEPVAPVTVGHAQRRPHDAGQTGHVGDLLEDALIHGTQERLGCVDARRHQHPRLLAGRDLPHAIADGNRLHRSLRCRR
jgi:hypothetical protein